MNVVMEVTQEEREKILNERIESARRAEIDECIEVIKRALGRIGQLGGSVYSFTSEYKSHPLTPVKIKAYYHIR